MSAAGRVMIDFPAVPGAPPGVKFIPPADVTRLLVGKAPEDVLKIVPAIHGVCATAQAHAAALALEGALGIVAPERLAAARQALTMMECLREHVFRGIIDWPKLMGMPVDSAPARQAMMFLPRFQAGISGALVLFDSYVELTININNQVEVIEEISSFLSSFVFGEPLDVWLSRRGLSDLRCWAENATTSPARFIAWLIETGHFNVAAFPPVQIPGSHNGKISPWVIVTDNVAGGTPEATPFIRRMGDPLLTSLGAPSLGVRFVARLVELARLPDEIRATLAGEIAPPMAAQIEPGTGYGAVEAARGLLLHTVTLEAGRVVEYRILPPTGWNFAAHGIVARCLSVLTDADQEARRLCAHLVVNAVDPCVSYEVRAA